MASPDVFLASPPRKSKQCIVPSSSPDLPSVYDIFSQNSKRPAINGGSKVIPTPDNATSSFTSTRDLWRSAQEAEVNHINPSQAADQLIVIDENDSATALWSNPSNKTPPRSQKRSSARQKIEQETGQQEPQIDEKGGGFQQSWREFKPKTPEKDMNGVLELSELSKTSQGPRVSEATDYRSPSRSQTPKPSPVVNPRLKKWDSEEPLQLEPAMTRRKSWTPPPPILVQTAIPIDTVGDSQRSELPEPDDDDEKSESFSSILATYKCDDGTIDDGHSCQSDGSASKRRKLTTVKHDEALPPAIPLPKPKAPRKKARTITALAMAAYKQATQVDSADIAKNTNQELVLQQPVANKGKAKPRKRLVKSKKKAEPPKPILFSPETALKQVAQQDFVFGTSSQLAREQSPTFLRDLQRAMKSSNQLDEVEYTTPLNSDSIEPLESRPKLWDAAARDADGDLFDVEVINLVDSLPQTPGDPFGYFKGDQSPKAGRSCPASKDDDGFLDLSAILPVKLNAAVEPELPSMVPDPSPSPKRQDGTHPPNVQSPSPQSPNAAAHVEKSISEPALDQPARPIFENYTDAQLSKEVSRYGFKPIKRRSAMISLLNQCWQQKAGSNGQQVRMKSTAASPKAKASTPTKRPRGRPRKDSASSSHNQDPPPSAQVPETPKRRVGRPRKVIEIPDSESDLAGSPHSSPASSPSTCSPQQVDLTMSLAEDAELSLTMASSLETESNLSDYIMKAVTTAPRTTIPTEPSWHEKILMYDPIVLEDLATWLNSGQLSRVGWDEEVNPVALKKWCESKSICCLWKVNLRGQERKRY